MVKDINSTEIAARASQGYVKDYYGTSTSGRRSTPDAVRSDIDFNKIKNLLQDHTFNYLVNKNVNSCTVNGFKIVERKNPSKRNAEKEDELRSKFGYDNELERSVFLNALVYKNLFLETEYAPKTKAPKELHLLEATEMLIHISPHGEVKGYTQEHVTGTKTASVFFKPNECGHLAINKIGTNPYGDVDTKAISHVVDYKIKVENYLAGLFEKNMFRDFFNIKGTNTNSSSIKAFIENIKEGQIQVDKSIIAEGDVQHKILRDMQEIEYLSRLIDKYEEKISRFLLVPPLMGGDVGSSSRSTGEFEVRYDYSTTIRSIQKSVADFLTYKIFPNIGFGDYMLVYNSFDKIDHEKTLQIAAQLRGLGYPLDTIHSYLVDNGINLPPDAKPVEQEVPTDGAINQTLQNANAPSRQDKTKTVIGNQKTGEDSTTREEQIVGRSKKFSGYPYVFETL